MKLNGISDNMHLSLENSDKIEQIYKNSTLPCFELNSRLVAALLAAVGCYWYILSWTNTEGIDGTIRNDRNLHDSHFLEDSFLRSGWLRLAHFRRLATYAVAPLLAFVSTQRLSACG
jgi:hypothetical protein